MNCRISTNPLVEFMEFGKTPLGNGFLDKKDFSSEYFYNMSIGYCQKSKMVQLLEQPTPSKMFHDKYAFFTGTSRSMVKHFSQHALDIDAQHLTSHDPFIIEIGCNDGTFLEYFAKKKIRHLGVEPSQNVAQIAQEKGIHCICDFFSTKSAQMILESEGKADVITAANVICHIPDFLDVLQAVAILLKDGGVFIFEEPYLGDVVQKTSYDQFYDEHVYMFSGMSVSYAAALSGLEIIRFQHLDTHGGSMRYYLSKKLDRKIDESVMAQIQQEKSLGLDKVETFIKFRKNCEQSRDKLKQILESLRKKSIPVVGYAATSKSTTVMQYCDITPDHLQYICDTTPIKQGKFSPGAHIPIRSYEYYQENLPTYSLLFAWNHKEEIIAKEKVFNTKNGKWIQYVPTVSISE